MSVVLIFSWNSCIFHRRAGRYLVKLNYFRRLLDIFLHIFSRQWSTWSFLKTKWFVHFSREIDSRFSSFFLIWFNAGLNDQVFLGVIKNYPQLLELKNLTWALVHGYHGLQIRHRSIVWLIIKVYHGRILLIIAFAFFPPWNRHNC